MRTRWLVTAMLVSASALAAQEPTDAPEPRPARTPEIRPFAGAFVPTGAMRDDFRTATMVGLQVATEMSRDFHVLASAGWTHGHNRFGLGSDRTDIWQYDAGVEASRSRPLASGWTVRPFLGLGGGARTYDYRVAGMKSRSCAAGYGAVGTEFEAGAMGVRFEARDYVSCFKSPVTGRRDTRNDLGLTLGVSYHMR